MDELFNRPLVFGPGADPADYLMDLRAHVTGEGTRRRRPRRAGKEGPLDPKDHTDPVPPNLPVLEKPLLLQLLDAVADDVPAGQASSYGSALATLAGRPHEELELRLRETLGLAAHRLDAWITGLASRALAAKREEDGALKIGGFGWVEHLVPTAKGTRETQGFIHAPSLEHAATAAVLRSGWNAHGSHDPESSMAVDLRSERVRTAAYLLDGVRRGGTLGDLLGCRFERRLHDLRLDHFIDDCRRRVLESQGITRAPRGPVDGLLLAELYHETGIRIDLPDGTSFTVVPGIKAVQTARAGLQGALNDLLAGMDAVADASIADSLHHLLQGNAEHASATLDSIATGAVPPPRLGGLNTPVTGASVSHRLVVTLAVGAPAPSGWGTSPRSELEPALSAWLAGLLGDPTKVRCSVEVLATGERVSVTLADLRVSPLDAVFESLGTWERRAQAHVLAKPAHAKREGGLVVEAAPTGLAEGELGFADLADLAGALRTLVAGARPLDARDLTLPAAEPESGADLAEAGARLAGFRARLEAAATALDKLLPQPSEQDPAPVGKAGLAAIRSALAALAGFGIANAVPVHGYAEPGRAALHADAWAALGAATGRLDADTPLEAGFTLLPRFSAEASGFTDALDRSDELLEGDPAAAMGWLRGVARVRDGAAALERAITLNELLYDRASVRPAVGQLPAAPGEPWVALHAPPDRRRGALSWLALDHGGLGDLAKTGRAAGLVLDEWVELVPSGEVVTGVALNVDAPSSRPPQAMLLGLPPRDRSWDFDNVVDTLLEALEAAKLRAVDPDVLLGYGHHAPAIYPPVGIDSGLQEAPDG